MRVALLCATRRGLAFLNRLIELSPDSSPVVFSFREEPWEPPFLDDLQSLTVAAGGQFFETKQVGAVRWSQFWETTPLDLMLVVSWRYMIPPSVYQRPRQGTFVFHDSLLPKYRGFSPTVWAMINGEDHTGVTLFRIAEEVDAGPIVDQESVPIQPSDTIGVILDRVTGVYLALLERRLDSLLSGNAPCHPQDHAAATYTCKRGPEDNRISWSDSTEDIYNLIRAVAQPYPGAFTYFRGRQLKIWSAERLIQERAYIGRIPGRVVEVRQGTGSVVLTGDGALLLKAVQFENGPLVCAASVLKSVLDTLGT